MNVRGGVPCKRTASSTTSCGITLVTAVAGILSLACRCVGFRFDNIGSTSGTLETLITRLGFHHVVQGLAVVTECPIKINGTQGIPFAQLCVNGLLAGKRNSSVSEEMRLTPDEVQYMALEIALLDPQQCSQPSGCTILDKATPKTDPEATPRPEDITFGICAVDGKAKKMKQLTKELAPYGFHIIYIDDATRALPVEEWPVVDVLLAWHSDGFDLGKAQAYVDLRKPIEVNECKKQVWLFDRFKTYDTLKDIGIDVPKHIFVDRCNVPLGEDPRGFAQGPDFVELDGVRINKPFVEKPRDAEDHNVWLYRKGGGVCRLFRKVDDKSSAFDSDHDGRVRSEGSFIIEQQVDAGGRDVKVYGVGGKYAHAESRKSPGIDGNVERLEDGREARDEVLLTDKEEAMTADIVRTFGQSIIGLDMLRCSTSGRTFVIDVNGLSFVKSKHKEKYYARTAEVLRDFMLEEVARKAAASKGFRQASACASSSSAKSSKLPKVTFTISASCVTGATVAPAVKWAPAGDHVMSTATRGPRGGGSATRGGSAAGARVTPYAPAPAVAPHPHGVPDVGEGAAIHDGRVAGAGVPTYAPAPAAPGYPRGPSDAACTSAAEAVRDIDTHAPAGNSASAQRGHGSRSARQKDSDSTAPRRRFKLARAALAGAAAGAVVGIARLLLSRRR